MLTCRHTHRNMTLSKDGLETQMFDLPTLRERFKVIQERLQLPHLLQTANLQRSGEAWMTLGRRLGEAKNNGGYLPASFRFSLVRTNSSIHFE